MGDQLSKGGLFELRHKDVEATDDLDEITFMDDEKFIVLPASCPTRGISCGQV
jgi:hypothetical protein